MTTHVIIIEVGSGSRRLDARQSQPKSLDTVNAGNRPVLDWILHALRDHGAIQPTYVGGYHIEKVISRFPDLRVRYLPDRDRVGELDALLLCDPPPGDCLVLRATTLLLPSALANLPDEPVVVGMYGASDDPRPVGLFRLRSDVVSEAFARARTLAKTRSRAGLDDLVADLAAAGHKVARTPLDRLAAPVTDRAAVALAVFRGKAQTLENLAPLSRKAAVLPLVRFTIAEWRRSRVPLLARIRETLGERLLLVRSSTTSEDALAGSAAGKFRSVLDVDGRDEKSVSAAIDDVIASYATDGRAADEQDEVLVQPQLSNLVASGVLLTRDPQTGAPYFVLELDESSGRSDIVTSGAAGTVTTSYIAWSAAAVAPLPAAARQAIDVGQELVSLAHLDALDIEFGIDRSGVCHLFQARPLAVAARASAVSDHDLLDMVEHARTFVADRMRPSPRLAGASTVLGTMPDWNPAEMIGSAPRPLALSLYQALIGDASFAEARARLGYRDVTPEALVLAVGGKPYVDVRVSLNSLLPAGIDEAVAGFWTDACLDRLRREPALHDKLEFEVAITCLTPDWPAHAKRIAEAGIDAMAQRQFESLLRQLTGSIIAGQVEPVVRQRASLDQLAKRRQQILAARAEDIPGLGRQVRHLLDDCRRLGIVPFSILARYAFVAMAFLRGLRATGAIDAADYDHFLHAIPTVSSAIAADLRQFADGAVGQDVLISRYGHLRPNSYEITSPNYAARPEQYLRAPARHASVAGSAQDPIDILLGRRHAIEAAIAELDLAIDVPTLARFIVDSIAGREHAKFEFMKNLDAALESIATLGDRLDLSREQLSFIPIDEFRRLETDSVTQAIRSHLRRISAFNEKRWSVTATLRLPDLLREPQDVVSFRREEWRANFITRKHVISAPVWLDEAPSGTPLDGAIVMIRAADPGFDWIFGHPIAGMVTQYGGVASHMAIRAAEFALPAAIGCGGGVFETLRGATKIELDCANGILRRAE